MIAIEKNVPIPTSRARTIYPFHEMNVGDSFVCDRSTQAVRNNINSFVRTKSGAGKTFIARQDGARVRVWRTA